MAKSNNITLEMAYAHRDEVRALFSEYTQMLIEGDPTFKKYLEIQNYDQELLHLEEKYGLPEGRLYLAYWDGALAGCIGLRKIDGEACEMKRLFVRPQFRGRQIGSCLVEKITAEAKTAGYRYMLLDTLPFLPAALHIYKRMGFYEIPCYNNSPMDNGIYLRLDLI